MNQEDIVETLLKHDGHLESVNSTLSRMDVKMDNIIDVMSQQTVLAEKQAHMDRELKESFHRVYKRLESIETTQHTTGCPAFRQANAENLSHLDRLNRIDTALTWVLRGVISAIVGGLMYIIITKDHI